MICYPNFNGRLGAIHISDVRPCFNLFQNLQNPVDQNVDPLIRSSQTTWTMTAFIVSTFNEYYRKPSLYTAKTMIFVIITDLDVAILKNCQKMYPNILNITLQIHHMLLARTCLVGVPLMRMKQVGSY